MLLSLLAIVLTLILVVGIHEAGHALSAALFKVKIRRISIGFGKALLTWKDKAGREWVWALWPLGGYVQLLNSRIEELPPSKYSQSFDKKPIWQRCIILLSGSFANLTTAFLALILVNMIGYQQQVPLIQEVKPQSIAFNAGITADDRIVEIAGKPTPSWQEVGMNLIMALGKKDVPVTLVNREGLSHQSKLDLSQWRYQKGKRTLLSSLGITPSPVKANTIQVAGQGFFLALKLAFAKIVFLIQFFLVMIKQLFTNKIPFALLLGPLGLFEASIHSFFQGLSVFFYFIASLSLAVGLVNLFPFPGLDGGSLIYALVEKFRGKPVSVAFEILLHRLAFIVFIFLLFQLLMNDLQRYLTAS